MLVPLPISHPHTELIERSQRIANLTIGQAGRIADLTDGLVHAPPVDTEPVRKFPRHQHRCSD